jgi:hypothetical protein
MQQAMHFSFTFSNPDRHRGWRVPSDPTPRCPNPPPRCPDTRTR